MIAISKIGRNHLDEDRNRQDTYITGGCVKIVLDGCGDEVNCPYSEVGVRLFEQYFLNIIEEVSADNFVEKVEECFEKLLKIENDESFITKNFTFTIVACIETEEKFVIYHCGDGFLLLETQEEMIIQELLNSKESEATEYYIYNYYTNKEMLQEYASGATFTRLEFSKEMYSMVGIASDGLRYLSQVDYMERQKFENALRKRSNGWVSKFFNRNASKFLDDVTICY